MRESIDDGPMIQKRVRTKVTLRCSELARTVAVGSSSNSFQALLGFGLGGRSVTSATPWKHWQP